jgi:1-acyl-sn-glycerol-3-phosphate acyltransferase
VEGPIPEAGFVACNHLSYLDIIILAAIRPMRFISKKEVRSWPLFGWLARCAGTLFLDRNSPKDVIRVHREMKTVFEEKKLLAFFPEGTSSDGSDILPFFTALFEPAAASRSPVYPAYIQYQIQHGSVSQEVAYWGQMTFFPHFLNLLKKRKIEALAAFDHPIVNARDRKALCLEVRESILWMKAISDERRNLNPVQASFQTWSRLGEFLNQEESSLEERETVHASSPKITRVSHGENHAAVGGMLEDHQGKRARALVSAGE